MRRSEGSQRGTRKSVAWVTGVAVTLGALFVGGTIAGTEASGAPTPSAVVDDASTSGTNHFGYTGTWVNCGGCNAGAYQNSFKYSNTTGAKVTLTFVGTQATLYGYKEQWGGIAGVTVDGGPSVDVNLYNATQTLTGLFATPVLAQGTHTVTMTVTGRSSTGSKTINLDKADIFTAAAVTATPTTTTATPTTTTATPTTTTATPTTTTATPTTTTATPTTTTATPTTTTATPTTTAPSAPPTSVDDATTSGTDHFSYTGTWTECGGCNTGAYQDSFRYSGTVGSTATLTFSGTQATLYGYKEQWGGIAGVTVDGGPSVDVNLYAATQSVTALYTTPQLANGVHSVTMTVTGRSTSGNSTINIDKADVYHGNGPVVTPTATAPSSTSPSTASSTPTTSTSTPPQQGQGIASLTFDDSQQNHYDNVRPVLRAAGVNGTFYVVSDSLTWSGHLTGAEAKTLANEGDELGNHTRDHQVLTGLSSAQVEAEFADSQAAIKAATGITPTTCAYPTGASNSTVTAVAAKYFRACRSTQAGQNTGSNLSLYTLVTYYVQTSTTAADVAAAAAAAKANNTWVIFVYHGVGSIGSSDDVSTATLESHVAALKAAGISIQTVSSALATYGK